MGDKGGAEDLRAKFDNLKSQKTEREKEEIEKEAEAKKKFEDHEAVISACPVDSATKNLTYWWPEDDQFWKRWGWKVCGPNLIWSTCNLFLMFAVFIHWAALVKVVGEAAVNALTKEDKKVYNFGFDLPKDLDDFATTANMIPPLAAFAGATQRGVQCWMSAITGGRVHNTMNTVFICLPMLLASIFLSLSDCPFVAVWLVAILSGVAGGAFSSCVNSISAFFPKRSQGLALGIVAGLGNLGEAFAYGCAPLLVDVGICAGGESGSCDTKAFGGRYPFNLGIFWTVLLVCVAIPSWVKMNSAPGHGSEAGARRSVIHYFQLSAFGWFWSLVFGGIWWASEIGVADSMAVLVIRLLGFSALAFAFVQGSLYYLAPRSLNEKLRSQMAIIKTKDIWVMCSLYTASFGSLMAWCVVFPTLLGSAAVFAKMPDAPNPDDFAWIGPCIAGLSRVLGGYLADKYGGSTITLWSLILLILATITEAVLVILAVDMDDPTADFIVFVLVAVFIFFLAGLSSGSVFRQIGFLYPPETRGHALGFVSCIASYCAGVIALLLIQGVVNHKDSAHIVSFAIIVVTYIPIVVLNWWCYKRAASDNQC